jgi:hypothetical protein
MRCRRTRLGDPIGSRARPGRVERAEGPGGCLPGTGTLERDGPRRQLEDGMKRRVLFNLNHPPYGSERVFNGLRLADAVVNREQTEVRIFLMGGRGGGRNGPPETARRLLPPRPDDRRRPARRRGRLLFQQHGRPRRHRRHAHQPAIPRAFYRQSSRCISTFLECNDLVRRGVTSDGQ